MEWYNTPLCDEIGYWDKLTLCENGKISYLDPADPHKFSALFDLSDNGG